MTRWDDGPSDQDFVAAIKDFTEAHGYPPSRRDLMEALGLASTSSVQYRLVRLRDQGRVSYEDGMMRTLRVVS